MLRSFDHLIGGKIQLQQARQLRIAILLHHVDAIMAGDKVVNLVRKRISADAHVVHAQLVLFLDLVETLAQREVALNHTPGTRSSRFRPSMTTGAGTSLRAFSNLRASRSITLLILVGPLGVTGRVVVSRAARKVCGLGMRFPAACASQWRLHPHRGSAQSCPPASNSSAVSTLPRSSGLSGYVNGSDIQLFMPRSRSVSTNTGVCSRSARSKAA